MSISKLWAASTPIVRTMMADKKKSKVYYRQGTDVFLEGKSQPKFICSCENIEMADFIVERLLGFKKGD